MPLVLHFSEMVQLQVWLFVQQNWIFQVNFSGCFAARAPIVLLTFAHKIKINNRTTFHFLFWEIIIIIIGFFSVLGRVWAFIFAMLLTCQVHCVEREISFLVKTFGFHKKWIMRLSNPIVKSIEGAMRDFFHSSVVNWGNTSQVHRKCTFRSVILWDWKSAYS